MYTSPKAMTENELQQRYVCLNCGHVALISTYNSTGPKNDPDSEPYCPICVAFSDLINAADARWCDKDDCDVLAGGASELYCPKHGSDQDQQDYWDSLERDALLSGIDQGEGFLY